LESNQPSYVQVWRSTGASPPQLLFPQKESRQISWKLAMGERISVPLPAGSGTVTIRVSRAPFGPITRQEAVMLDRAAPEQLQESSPQEQATYVVNPDLAPTAQLTVDLPVSP
jgi:hypothetical protein